MPTRVLFNGTPARDVVLTSDPWESTFLLIFSTEEASSNNIVIASASVQGIAAGERQDSLVLSKNPAIPQTGPSAAMKDYTLSGMTLIGRNHWNTWLVLGYDFG